MTLNLGDNFFKTSERYRENPDYSPKHVGMPWTCFDASDFVRPTGKLMNWQQTQVDGAMPLPQAFKVYEDANLTQEQRKNLFEGPASPDKEFKSSEFKHYVNSGGISKKEDISQTLDRIAERLRKAQDIKGTLTLNNANNYGGTWKTPQLDLKFKQMHGGETAQRFYSKFPIYRHREEPPDVQDDIGEVYRKTIELMPGQKPLNFTFDKNHPIGSSLKTNILE